MTPAKRFEWCIWVLKSLPKLLLYDIEKNERSLLIHKLTKYCIATLIPNYVYTIVYCDNDPYDILLELAYFCAVLQVGNLIITTT